MTQLSEGYAQAARLLRARLSQLRRELARETDPERIFRLKYRIARMTPILSQMTELEELTRHYYDRGYWRNEKYTV